MKQAELCDRDTQGVRNSSYIVSNIRAELAENAHWRDQLARKADETIYLAVNRNVPCCRNIIAQLDTHQWSYLVLFE